MKYLFILVVLFFPLKFFLPYHMLLACLAFAMVLRHRKLLFDFNARVILLLLTFILASNIFRTFYFPILNIRDYMELFRYVPLFLLLLVRTRYKIEYESLCKILLIYTVVDFFVSALQVLNVPLIRAVSGFYASSFHMENSLGLSFRAIGLSRGPGDHGAFMVLILTFFFASIFYNSNRYNFWGCFIAAITVLLTQSQTSFVAMVFSMAVILCYYLFFGIKSQRNQAKKIGALLGIIGVLFMVYFFKSLRYLYTLVEQGTNRHSFQLRVQKMDFVNSEIANNLFLGFIGFGKDYWGDLSGAMDNEYLYIYSVYGFIVFVLAIILVVFNLYKGLFVDSMFQNKSIYFIIVAGLIVAYPASFFTEPRIILLLVFLGLLVNGSKKEEPIITSSHE